MVAVTTIFMSLLLSLFMLLNKSKTYLANRFLTVFLVLVAIDVSGWVFNSNNFLNDFRLALSLLQEPIFTGFVVSSCFSNFKITRHSILHILPFLISLILCFPGEQLPITILSSSGNIRDPLFQTPNEQSLIVLVSHIQFCIYTAYCFICIRRFKYDFHHNFSDERRLVYSWLLQLLCISLFAHALVLMRVFVSYSEYLYVFKYLQIISALTVLAILGWITLKALLQPSIFRGIANVDPGDKGPDGQVGLEVAFSEQDKTKLLQFMQSEKPYLDSNLSLPDLALKVGLAPRSLSELINNAFSVHFFDFINSYRVEEAKRLLLESPSEPIISILFDAGFNTKSSFNAAFKKHAEITPSQYRKQQNLLSIKGTTSCNQSTY